MDCPLAGKLFGCKFRPRYDEGRGAGYAFDRIGSPEAARVVAEMNRSLKPITYVRDVCERCGKTIERPQ